jgi:FKBP-type peptidyl-prolyl cis-trans isomerase (trigger factor)
VHDRLLLDAVAKAKDVRLDEQEFERFLAGIAREQKKSSLAVRQELDAAGRLPALRAQFLERQTLRLLMGEESPDAPADDPESSA